MSSNYNSVLRTYFYIGFVPKIEKDWDHSNTIYKISEFSQSLEICYSSWLTRMVNFDSIHIFIIEFMSM